MPGGGCLTPPDHEVPGAFSEPLNLSLFPQASSLRASRGAPGVPGPQAGLKVPTEEERGRGRGYRPVPDKPVSPTHVPNTLPWAGIDSHPGAGRWAAAGGKAREYWGKPLPRPALPASPEAESTEENLQPSPLPARADQKLLGSPVVVFTGAYQSTGSRPQSWGWPDAWGNPKASLLEPDLHSPLTE